MKSKEYPYDVPPDSDPAIQNGFPHRNFIRKSASSFSWDWGPGFAPMGIYEGISIDFFDLAIIKRAKVQPILLSAGKIDDGSEWAVNATVTIHALKSMEGTVVVNIVNDKDGDDYSSNVMEQLLVLTEGINNISVQMNTKNVKPWWPVGYGEPNLYKCRISFNPAYGDDTSDFETMIGFRTVELVQSELVKGHSFFFNVNDVPIFVKGSNWVPADAFQDRVTPELVQKLLQSAYDANINLVRNWGGGRYEQEAFYATADKLGIMVWQEFMFACAMYPTDKAFLDNVSVEAQDQVHRLYNHPSIILWSGNNENEVAIAQNWYNMAPADVPKYSKDYVTLYVDTIKSTVERLDDSRPFVVSSPSNGVESGPAVGYISKNPQDEYNGDVHYYNYKDNCMDIGHYPVPRFASEYGFQSFPSYQSLLEAIPSLNSQYFNSSALLHRQHHTDGNGQMTQQMEFHFNLPQDANAPSGLRRMLYLGQLTQALCMKAETEHYRRFRGQFLSDNRGHTMGTIYWQLNDIWQGASWSSLEYGGRWKMAHYAVADFYTELLVSPVETTDDHLDIFIVNDGLQLINDAYLNVQLWSWQTDFGNINPDTPYPSGGNNFVLPLQLWTSDFTVSAASSQNVQSFQISEMINEGGCGDRSKCFVTMDVFQTVTETHLTSNVFWLTPFKEVQLLDPSLAVKSVISYSEHTTTLHVCISSEAVALFVWLETTVAGRFSKNGFYMIQPVYCVNFYAETHITASDFQQTLSITSLYDQSSSGDPIVISDVASLTE